MAHAGLVEPAEVRKTMRQVAAGVGDLSLVQPVIETEAWMRAVHNAPALRWEQCP